MKILLKKIVCDRGLNELPSWFNMGAIKVLEKYSAYWFVRNLAPLVLKLEHAELAAYRGILTKYHSSVEIYTSTQWASIFIVLINNISKEVKTNKDRAGDVNELLRILFSLSVPVDHFLNLSKGYEWRIKVGKLINDAGLIKMSYQTLLELDASDKNIYNSIKFDSAANAGLVFDLWGSTSNARLKLLASLYLVASDQIDEKHLPTWEEIQAGLVYHFSFELNKLISVVLIFYKPHCKNYVDLLIECYLINKDCMTEQQWESLSVSVSRSLMWLGLLKLLDLYACIFNYEKVLPYHYFAKQDCVSALALFRYSNLQTLFTGKLGDVDSNPVLVIPSTLAGEIQESFFWSVLHNAGYSLCCVCDSRLKPIFERSFPKFRFHGQSSVRKIRSDPNLSNSVPQMLRRFLDNRAYTAIKNRLVARVPYVDLYNSFLSVQARHEGWLVPNDLIKAKINNLLSELPRPLIGIAIGTTHTTSVRKKMTSDIESLASVERNRIGTLINIDASSSIELLKLHAASIVDLKIDLYNDLESLVALFSCLDGAVVPQNNLMEIACAVGIPAVVVSPTESIKGCLSSSDNNYAFGAQVSCSFDSNLLNAYSLLLSKID